MGECQVCGGEVPRLRDEHEDLEECIRHLRKIIQLILDGRREVSK